MKAGVLLLTNSRWPLCARSVSRRVVSRRVRLPGERLQRVENAVRAGIDPDGGDIAPVDSPRPVEDEQCALRDAFVPAGDAKAARDRSLGPGVWQPGTFQLAAPRDRDERPRPV